jgi:hypothetical protein
MKSDPGRIFRIANSLGWTIKFGVWPIDDSVSYHQKVLTLAVMSPKDMTVKPVHASLQIVQSIAHEIGHYIVAPPSRRYRKDYGIPRDHRNDAYWNLDEMKARFVERELVRACGMKRANVLLISGVYKKPAEMWWEQEGKHLVAGLLLIK